MADKAKRNLTPITEADLTNVDTFLQSLKKQAQDYYAQKNLVMLGIYADLIKLVSPRVTRLHARYERESTAGVNRNRKELALAGAGDQGGA